MSRPVFLVIVLALIGAGIWYLSTLPREVPTQTIEAPATPPGNAN